MELINSIVADPNCLGKVNRNALESAAMNLQAEVVEYVLSLNNTTAEGEKPTKCFCESAVHYVVSVKGGAYINVDSATKGSPLLISGKYFYLHCFIHCFAKFCLKQVKVKKKETSIDFFLFFYIF
jgi:hypothetical protein